MNWHHWCEQHTPSGFFCTAAHIQCLDLRLLGMLSRDDFIVQGNHIPPREPELFLKLLSVCLSLSALHVQFDFHSQKFPPHTEISFVWKRYY